MTPFSRTQINFVGGENKSRSKLFASEETINLYESVQSTGRSGVSLLPWPGEKLFSNGGFAVQRGGHVFNGVPYVVNNQSLVKVLQDGTKENIGIIDGLTRCSFADDGNTLVIRNGQKTYSTDGSSLTEAVDTDIESAQTLAYVNQQFIYQGLDARFGVSDAGLPTSVNGLNYATAESYGDDLKQVYVFEEKLYLFGSESKEVWFNSGVGNPPFDKIQGSTSRIGVPSAYGVASTNNYMYFVGSDDRVYRVRGYKPESISPESISKEIRERETGDAIGIACNLDGLDFYVIQLPSSNYTLVYCEQTGKWSRLSSGMESGAHLINGYLDAYGKKLILTKDSSAIYEWDFDTYTSNGATIIRQRVSAPINGLAIGLPGRKLISNGMSFIMETGVGNADQPDPKMMVSLSFDGGRSYDNEYWVDLGRINESRAMANLNVSFSFYDLVIKIRVSDPVFTGFHGATINLKDGGQ